MKPFLKVDEKTSLHLPRPGLAETIFEVINTQRTYLRKWLPWVDPTQSSADTLQYIKESIAYNRSGERLTTFIYYENTFVGTIAFVHFKKKNKSGEIGYWLSKEFQGKGIMTKVCERMIRHAFRSKGLNRIEIMVATENQKSSAIPKRLGFKHEGTLRQGLLMNGDYFDLDLFSLLKKEWGFDKNVKTKND